MTNENKNFGIYIHVPFCVNKCNYCSFVSKKANSQEIQKYIDFLCEEITLKAKQYKDKKVTSLYFGGGTPSYINELHIKRIIKTLQNNFNIDKNAEISIECNPCSISKEKLEIYKSIGINRISFGVQSLNNKLLKILGRKHTSSIAENAIKMAREVGYTNISADLMIGIPNQTESDLIDSLTKLISFGVTHISAYMLMLEEHTPLFNDVNQGLIKVANDDQCVDMYNHLVKVMQENNFNRYEISNFSINGYECKHNINYWDMGEYLGFGVASHSFINDTRFANYDNFEDYYNIISALKNNSPIHKKEYAYFEKLTKQQLIEETIMLGLRQKKGVYINNLLNLGYDVLNVKQQELLALQQKNIIEIKNNYIKIKPKHFGVCNAIVLKLI